MAQTEQDRELGIVAAWILGLLAVAFLWKQKVRPWMNDQWPALSNGESASILGVTWDVTDCVGLGALVLVIVGSGARIRRSVKAGRAARRAAQEAREGARVAVVR